MNRCSTADSCRANEILLLKLLTEEFTAVAFSGFYSRTTISLLFLDSLFALFQLPIGNIATGNHSHN